MTSHEHEHPDDHVELEAIDPPGPPETVPHPLEVDEAEAARGQAVYEAIDDLDDDSDGVAVATQQPGGTR